MAYITSLGQPVLSSRAYLVWPILDTLQQNDTMKRKAFSSHVPVHFVGTSRGQPPVLLP